MRQSLIVVLALSTLVSACNRQPKEDNDNEASAIIEATLESGLTAVSGVADDEAGAVLAQQKSSNLYSALIPNAYAATCGRARFEACVPSGTTGIRTATYNSCSLANGRVINGQVTLTYSDVNCNMDVGDSVQRQTAFNISGPYGGQIAISSATSTDYRGVSYGGGGLLTRLDADSWSMRLNGKRKVLTRNGRTLFDIQVRTTQDLSVEGTLARSGRVIDGGAIEVAHNLARFTATFTPNQLTWSGSCCHPISGSLTVNYSGSISGTGSVTFQGCGQAILTKNGVSESVLLNYCE